MENTGVVCYVIRAVAVRSSAAALVLVRDSRGVCLQGEDNSDVPAESRKSISLYKLNITNQMNETCLTGLLIFLLS